MGMYFDDRYVSRRKRFEDRDTYEAQCNNWGIPSEYYLGTTPLNESLVVMNKLVPMFKKKYNIEKLTFITLTDGSLVIILEVMLLAKVKKIGKKLMFIT